MARWLVTGCLCLALLGGPARANADEDRAIASEPVAHPGRALLQTATILGVGLAWYAIDYAVKDNHDGEFPLSLDTYRRKLFTLKGTRFDTSSPFHNGVGHAAVGGYYYNAWRSNGFTAWESFWAAAAVSVFWEYLIEYREVASINDLIVTNFGGLGLGEAAHQMATALVNGSDAIPATAVAAFFDPWLVLNRGLDKAERAPEFLDTADWRFDLTGGAGFTRYQDSGDVRFEVEAGVRNTLTRGLSLEGDTSRWYWGALHSELLTRVALSLSLSARLELFAESQFFGYLWQGQGRERYFLVGFGPSVGLDIHPFPNNRDFVTQVAPFGLSLAGLHRSGDVTWRLWGDAAPCFGVVHSMVIGEYEGDLSTAKTTLREHGYYYAYGLTTRLALTLEWGPVTFGAAGRYAAFRSIQGLDRRQDNVTDDFSLRDQRLGTTASLQVGLGPLALEAAWDRYFARGQIVQSAQDAENRFFARVVWGAR